ncbi:MAG: TRAP transporter small permease [Clostridium sp.]|nr:TRAP transporter small permease [Clostridium sp.]
MNSISKTRFKIEEYVTAVLLGLLVFLVFIAAMLRWVGISIVWSVDLAQFLLTWLCFVGADIAYAKNKHMGVDLFKNLLPEHTRIIVNILIDLLFVVFMSSILYFGVRLSLSNWVRKFNALPVSYSFATLSAPVGAFLMILTGVGKMAGNLRLLRGRRGCPSGSGEAGGSI